MRHLLYHQPQHSILPEEHHGSKWVADRTIDFLRRADKKPFFLWSSWIAPHPPYNVPDSWADIYKGAPIPDPIPAPEEYPPHTGDSQGTGDIEDDPVRMRRHREIYYASIAFIDHQIGRILDELEVRGLAQNTLVIFTSDHGEMAGDLGIYQKSHPYEGCCHIPFITRWPGRIDPASRRSEFVDLNDILPTCLDAAGLEYPGEHELPGESLLIAPGDGAKDRTIQYIENARVEQGMTGHQNGSNRWRQIRDERFKFSHFCNGGYELLVDTWEDPQERCNLMNSKRTEEQEAAYRRLRAKLVEYETRWGVEEGIVDGDLAFVERYETPGPRGRRCSATPSWPPNLEDADEIAAMNTIEYEMRAVIAKEPTVKLSKLDLEAWAESTGFHDLAEKFKLDK